MKVFIGVGHGGRDAGAVANGLREADCNLVMALAMKQELERHAVTVGISRTKDVEDTTAEEVAKCQSFAPDLAVEIHNNAGGGRGFEAYYQGGRKYHHASKRLALLMECQVQALGQESRGIKRNEDFLWLKGCHCPAVLCEGFFLDGVDHVLADTVEEQQQFGRAYARAVLEYFHLGYEPEACYSGPIWLIRPDNQKQLVYVNKYLRNGLNYVSLREFAEVLGHAVGYDQTTKTPIVYLGDQRG